MKGKKKVPKGYKKKVPGYVEGGTTIAPSIADPDRYNKEELRKSKGAFDNFVSNVQNVGVGILDAGLGLFGANDAVDFLYSKNRSASGSKSFGNTLGDLSEKFAPTAAGLVGTALAGPAGGAIARTAVGGLQTLGNRTDVDPVTGMQDGGDVSGKKKLFPTKEDAKIYVQNSEYIDKARQLLNDELTKRLKLKAGQPIPENAILAPEEVASTLKGSGLEDYYNKVRWMDDYYRRYGSPANTVAGQNEPSGSVEDTAYGARHRAAKYAKLRQPTESDIIINKIISEKNKQQESVVPDFMGIPLKKNGGMVAAGKKADGGEIEGPGTPKSDSIHANIKPGSFVVPAENAHIGEKLRMLYLGGDKKAKLNQGGGVGVRLSDGEHLFSPEESEYLRNMVGINLDALAPKAKNNAASFAEGGEVEEMLKSIQKIEQEIKQKQSQIDADLVKQKQDAKGRAVSHEVKRRSAEEIKKLNEIKKDLDAKVKVIREYEKLPMGHRNRQTSRQQHIDQFKNTVKKYEDQKKNVDTFSDPKNYEARETALGGVNAVYSPKKSSTQKSVVSTSGSAEISDIAGVKNILTPKSSSQDGDLSSDVVSPVAALDKPSSGVRPTRRSAQSDDVIKKVVTPEVVTPVSGPEYDFMAENDRVMNVDPNKIPRETASATTENTPAVAADVAASDKSNPFSNIGFGDILGLAQVGIGAGSLISDGSRPVDNLSPEYLDVVKRATQDAAYGFDPASRAAYERDIESARLGGVNLSAQLAGGDAGKALANARSFTNQYSGNMLDFFAADNELKMQKRRYADTLVRDKVEQQRRLFEDKLNAFNVNQEAGASTLAAGITSLQNSQRNKDIDKLLAGLNT